VNKSLTYLSLWSNNISAAGAKELAEALYYRKAIGGFPDIDIYDLDGLDKALTDIRALKPDINNIKPKSLSEPKDNSEMNNKITELQGQVKELNQQIANNNAIINNKQDKGYNISEQEAKHLKALENTLPMIKQLHNNIDKYVVKTDIEEVLKKEEMNKNFYNLIKDNKSYASYYYMLVKNLDSEFYTSKIAAQDKLELAESTLVSSFNLLGEVPVIGVFFATAGGVISEYNHRKDLYKHNNISNLEKSLSWDDIRLSLGKVSRELLLLRRDSLDIDGSAPLTSITDKLQNKLQAMVNNSFSNKSELYAFNDATVLLKLCLSGKVLQSFNDKLKSEESTQNRTLSSRERLDILSVVMLSEVRVKLKGLVERSDINNIPNNQGQSSSNHNVNSPKLHRLDTTSKLYIEELQKTNLAKEEDLKKLKQELEESRLANQQALDKQSEELEQQKKNNKQMQNTLQDTANTLRRTEDKANKMEDFLQGRDLLDGTGGQVTTVKYNNPNSQSRNPADINRDVIGLESNQNNIILELQELKEKTKEDKSKSQKEIDDLKKMVKELSKSKKQSACCAIM